MEVNKQASGLKRVIPIMPCLDIRHQIAFYQALGFEVLDIQKAPNPYASIRLGSIELHFYGTRKVQPFENSTMCFLMVEDVYEINRTFTTGLKAFYGKIPRSGFPKITKVRCLVMDCRFTLTDPGGNTLFIGMPSTEEDRYFRTLDSGEYAKAFAALYDVVYSKEDPGLAQKMLPKYESILEKLHGLDKAKYMLLSLDLWKQLDGTLDDRPLIRLIEEEGKRSVEWKRIEEKLRSIHEGD